MKNVGVILALSALLATRVVACPSCGPATKTAVNDGSRKALIVSGTGMLLLPMGMVAGLAFWLKKRL